MKRGILGLVSFFSYLWFFFGGESLWGYSESFLLAENYPFKPGEKIVYRLNYKGIKVGKAELTFHGEEKLRNKEVFLVTFSTQSLYFKDLERIFADKENFLPLRVERKIRGLAAFPTTIEENYDQENFKVRIRKKTLFFSKNFVIDRDSPINNAVLLSYYYRKKKEFKLGEEFLITLPTKSFKLIFKGREKVSTPLGEFWAYLLEADSSCFKLWFKDDEERVPLKMEVPEFMGYSLVIESIEKGR
ncbi:MAG: DUF3108 domain-containing protein [Candidatus Omnitrophica bacterium]|nr:DUF3108 domain-containing protein [Candidatus Omnitrophota bacterium]